MNKRYYWLKFREDFFDRPDLKKLRRIAGGDTYLIIYQKILLLSIKNNGKIIYQQLEPTIEEELALILNEDLNNIKITFSFMLQRKLIAQKNKSTYELPEMRFLIGSETQSTIRSRVCRSKKQKEYALQCNVNATLPQLISNKKATPDIDIDIEKDKDSLALTPTGKGDNREKIFLKIKSLKTFKNYNNDGLLRHLVTVKGTKILEEAQKIDKKEKEKFDNEPKIKDPGAYLLTTIKNIKT
jgi:predicted phage replisome organizer